MSQTEELMLLDQIAASLRCLGDTPGEVQYSLLRDGVRYVRQDRSGDPIVAYLERRRDIAGRLEIPEGADYVVVMTRDEFHRVALPMPVVQFLERMRAGFYPGFVNV